MESARKVGRLRANLLGTVMAEQLLVFGAGGHAKVIIDTLEKQERSRNLLVYDDNPETWGGSVLGYQIVGGLQILLKDQFNDPHACAIVAIGDNHARLKVARTLTQNGIKLCSAIHPSAVISREVKVGAGTVLFAGSVVNADSDIGDNVIVNTAASVDHDCIVEDGVHIAPGAVICGGVDIGRGSFIGAGSVIIPGLRIGRNVIVGAGSTVLKDLEDGARVAGTPAKNISK